MGALRYFGHEPVTAVMSPSSSLLLLLCYSKTMAGLLIVGQSVERLPCGSSRKIGKYPTFTNNWPVCTPISEDIIMLNRNLQPYKEFLFGILTEGT